MSKNVTPSKDDSRSSTSRDGDSHAGGPKSRTTVRRRRSRSNSSERISKKQRVSRRSRSKSPSSRRKRSRSPRTRHSRSKSPRSARGLKSRRCRSKSRSPRYRRSSSRSKERARSSRSPRSRRSRSRSQRSKQNRSRSSSMSKAKRNEFRSSKTSRSRRSRSKSLSYKQNSDNSSSSSTLLANKSNLVPGRSSDLVSPGRSSSSKRRSPDLAFTSLSNKAFVTPNDDKAQQIPPNKIKTSEEEEVKNRLSHLLEISSTCYSRESLLNLFGEELLKKFKKQERKVCIKLDEEFEVYRDLPHKYSRYGECYRNFMEKYVLQFPDQDEKHKHWLWTAFWKSNFENVKKDELKRRISTLMTEYVNKSYCSPTSTSTLFVPNSPSINSIDTVQNVIPTVSASPQRPAFTISSFSSDNASSPSTVHTSHPPPAPNYLYSSPPPLPSLTTPSAHAPVLFPYPPPPIKSVPTIGPPPRVVPATSILDSASSECGSNKKQSYKDLINVKAVAVEAQFAKLIKDQSKQAVQSGLHSGSSSVASLANESIKEVTEDRKAFGVNTEHAKSSRQWENETISKSSSQKLTHHRNYSEGVSSTSSVHRMQSSLKADVVEGKTAAGAPRSKSHMLENKDCSKHSLAEKSSGGGLKASEGVENDVKKTLNLLESVIPDMSYLGHSITGMLEKVKELGNTTKEALKVFTEPENIALLEMGLRKIKSKCTSERNMTFSDNLDKKINSLLDYAQQAQKKTKRLNIEAIANATTDQDTGAVIDMIRNVALYQGLQLDNKEVNEIFLQVCSLHLERSMSK